MRESGAPERIRTSDLCLRRAALYPAELRARDNLDSGQAFERQRRFWRAIRYLKVIKSVRLRVEAFVFKGSLVAFALF